MSQRFPDLSLSTPVRILFEEKDMSKLIELVENNIERNKIMCHACRIGWVELVEYLVNHTEVDIHAYNESPFRGACQSGKVDLVRYLTRKGGVCNNIALTSAAVCGCLEVVKYLVEELSIRPEENEHQAYRHAKQMGKENVAQYLETYVSKKQSPPP
jgi:ankyrin repeat protein